MNASHRLCAGPVSGLAPGTWRTEPPAKFYASFGFVAISGEYLEDGIPHVDMRLEPSETD
ncbi:GCN5-related N-acetyltransferase [Brucella sp. NF 2653]|nr:GCN5-related N-acetyltransferase [Brucella sp. NF 2653]